MARESGVGVDGAPRGVAERFWKRVGKTEGCWEWSGKQFTHDGYGRMWMQGKNVTTHRVSWLLHYGSIPDGMCVLHGCDNRKCVRPDHLRLGTKADNAHDTITRGRAHFKAVVLTAETARRIRALAASGQSNAAIAKGFGLTRGTVFDVVTGRSWKNA